MHHQIFSPIIKLWSNVCLHSDTLSPLVSALVRTMSMLRSKKTALDPPQFLRCLENVLIKSTKCAFNLFQQKDSSKIISCDLEELCVE